MSKPAPVPFNPAPVPGTETPPVAVMPQPSKTKKREIPSYSNEVLGAKITVSFRGEDGKIYEAVHTVSGEEYVIQSQSLTTEKKYEKDKDPETGKTIGFEDTGERILTFKLRYHVK